MRWALEDAPDIGSSSSRRSRRGRNGSDGGENRRTLLRITAEDTPQGSFPGHLLIRHHRWGYVFHSAWVSTPPLPKENYLHRRDSAWPRTVSAEPSSLAHGRSCHPKCHQSLPMPSAPPFASQAVYASFPLHIATDDKSLLDRRLDKLVEAWQWAEVHAYNEAEDSSDSGEG
jgi:hypothetical protein